PDQTARIIRRQTRDFLRRRPGDMQEPSRKGGRKTEETARIVHRDLHQIGAKSHAIAIGLTTHPVLAAAMIMPDDALRLIDETITAVDDGKEGCEIVAAARPRSGAQCGVETTHAAQCAGAE